MCPSTRTNCHLVNKPQWAWVGFHPSAQCCLTGAVWPATVEEPGGGGRNSFSHAEGGGHKNAEAFKVLAMLEEGKGYAGPTARSLLARH